jgi:hypothetical protein
VLDSDFLAEFKRATETRWHEASIDPHLYGFQFQAGTRWNPGLSEEQITEFANCVGFSFPNDFRELLRVMNGTDLPTLNIYGYCGESPRQSIGVYSYPRDLDLVVRLMREVHATRNTLTDTMLEQGFDITPSDNLLPIYGYRYLVCTPHLDSSVVLSIDGPEYAIVYGHSLQEYLEAEFLKTRS